MISKCNLISFILNFSMSWIFYNDIAFAKERLWKRLFSFLFLYFFRIADMKNQSETWGNLSSYLFSSCRFSSSDSNQIDKKNWIKPNVNVRTRTKVRRSFWPMSILWITQQCEISYCLILIVFSTLFGYCVWWIYWAQRLPFSTCW